jgi:hypothetical protein
VIQAALKSILAIHINHKKSGACPLQDWEHKTGWLRTFTYHLLKNLGTQTQQNILLNVSTKDKFRKKSALEAG